MEKKSQIIFTDEQKNALLKFNEEGMTPTKKRDGRPQAPQAENTWCMRQFVYIENCMGKSPIVKNNWVNNYLI